ncbi:hypothetical protein KX816_16515 [Sphingosinicellaceae bacterium]|nr:hypothetical protein KX816_16515 [Sphingosinicellaceae bacterium]
MTNPARAREILDSYGADSARWPGEEREAVIAALRSNPALRTQQAEAAELDAMLGEWARRDVGAGVDAGAAAARVLQPARPWRRWAAGGGGLAAALAAVLLIGTPTPAPVPVATVSTGTAAPLTAAGAFSTLFTTTPDEEDVL